ncbi:tripartite tricarboxylate transporter substrate binding protein [Limnohabitans sp. B9-3]|uniref:tripartite tricarboxylate transporter substrate binding protein n=1 Tax=Limnohabitans sp. B9-3 TaxID=1100707 RepID=UPI000C1F4476|nr:tripartite tricarboxylate transporter substrate binding protein [Limnohabitans sp. B9-3]PIT71332.1 tripartite tricarboxylate transporter receptor protein [Limnohabitans sp. B9-3]
MTPHSIMKKLFLWVCLCVPFLAGAQAQPFPTRAITLIVPFAAGGPADIHTRAVVEEASKALGQTIVVENKPGASGTNGALTLLRAPADGYTLALLTSTLYREPHLTKVKYDPLKDFAYILLMSDYTQGVAVRADAPWKTWQEFVADAALRPNKINVGVNGIIGAPRIVMEEAADASSVQLNMIPYKGDSEIVNALLGGHLDAAPLSGIATAYIDDGKLRYLALLTENRVKRYPTVPTLKEGGIDVWMSSPYGVGAPSGTDPARLRILHDAFKRGLESPASQRAMQQLNQLMYYRNQEDYRSYVVQTFAQEKVRVERLRKKGLLD